MGKSLRQANVQSEHRNGTCEDPRTQKSGRTNQKRNPRCRILRPTLFTTGATKQAPCGRFGRNRFTEREATVGPQWECGRKSLCATRFRISGRRLGKVLAAVGRLCAAIEAHCDRTSTDLDLLSALVSELQGRRRWKVRCVMRCRRESRNFVSSMHG